MISIDFFTYLFSRERMPSLMRRIDRLLRAADNAESIKGFDECGCTRSRCAVPELSRRPSLVNHRISS